jgi:hypothetical protein
MRPYFAIAGPWHLVKLLILDIVPGLEDIGVGPSAVIPGGEQHFDLFLERIIELVPVPIVKKIEELVYTDDAIEVNLEKFGKLDPIIVVFYHLVQVLEYF